MADSRKLPMSGFRMSNKQIAEVVAKLDQLPGGDAEGEHGIADAILLSAVPPQVRAAWEQARTRNGGFYYA